MNKLERMQTNANKLTTPRTDTDVSAAQSNNAANRHVRDFFPRADKLRRPNLAHRLFAAIFLSIWRMTRPAAVAKGAAAAAAALACLPALPLDCVRPADTTAFVKKCFQSQRGGEIWALLGVHDPCANCRSLERVSRLITPPGDKHFSNVEQNTF